VAAAATAAIHALRASFDQLLGSKDRSGLSQMRDELEASRAATPMGNAASWKPGRYGAEKHDLTKV